MNVFWLKFLPESVFRMGKVAMYVDKWLWLKPHGNKVCVFMVLVLEFKLNLQLTVNHSQRTDKYNNAINIVMLNGDLIRN